METDIRKVDDECFLYHGYTIHKNGDIFTPRGNKLNGYFITYPGSHVKIKIGETYKSINKAKLIYMLFSGADKTITNKYYILFKDGDSTNTAYDNMYLGLRSEYAKEKGCDGKPKFTPEEIEKIIIKYNTTGISLRKLALECGCSLLTIQKILGKKISREL